MSLLILVVDDEPDVETLFRQQFRRDLRNGRFIMEFAQSAPIVLQRITDAAGVLLIADKEDNRNCLGRLLCRNCRRFAACRRKHRHSATNKVGSELGQPIILTLGPAEFDRHVLALNIAKFLQALAKCGYELREWTG
jgi:CheY-like chemotaxis protein